MLSGAILTADSSPALFEFPNRYRDLLIKATNTGDVKTCNQAGFRLYNLKAKGRVAVGGDSAEN